MKWKSKLYTAGHRHRTAPPGRHPLVAQAAPIAIEVIEWVGSLMYCGLENCSQFLYAFCAQRVRSNENELNEIGDFVFSSEHRFLFILPGRSRMSQEILEVDVI